MAGKEVIKNIFTGKAGEAPLFFMLGPCVIEDEATTLKTLEGLLKITGDMKVPFIFKASYDKANRTSLDSYRGPGLREGLKVLQKAAGLFPEVPILTDVHCRTEVAPVAEVVDIIQIPAFLSRQTNLIVEAALTGLPVNIKKGQFMSPADMTHSVDKARSTGAEQIMITERGVSFGYNNLVVDFRSLPLLRALGFPVIFDATHSVQSPGGMGGKSGGDRTMARYLARAAAACGVDGFFMEVHPDPEHALCDGPNSLALSDVKDLLTELLAIDSAVRGFNGG
ncbi:MAG: 3-deoxy-8-phosphooctulonate synthase [Thermodesulfobacteriota bacterium]